MGIPKKLESRSKAHDERNDCSIKAVAIVCNAEYDEVHEIMRQLGRRNKHRTPRHITLKAIRKLGCWVGRPIECKAKTVRHLPSLLPSGRWLVVTRGHILAVVDGEVLDWTEGRRHRPITMWEIRL